ncbi:hypothetical protein CTI14_07575, partial [Methylobacterium radiotolerans]
GTTLTTRLIADYLVDSEFQLAQIGSSTFTKTPSLRATRCGTTLTTRLIADYLVDSEFQLAQIGSSTFTKTPSSATGGFPYISVRTALATAVTTPEGTTRVPATGESVSIATSRTIDPP